jgi:transcriptional regulator with GAF, ATPase, and Fis domain
MQHHLPSVLIEGETGTGKTTIARWIHHHGPRAQHPLVEMNCSALPENLAESELFGHERGAFTDARSARMGLFEAASGGTLFLDELPSLSLGLQAKVLKALEDHKIRRLGGRKEIPVDVRIVAATHQDLRRLMESGAFRADLFHRLDLYRIQLPPLRERPGDIPDLAERLIKGICQRHRLSPKPLTAAGLRRLQSCPWPGNVRELAHELERAVVFEEGPTLSLEQLQPAPGHTSPAATAGDKHDWINPEFVIPEEGFELDAAINRLIQRAMDQTKGNVSAAARLLGVTRDYLRYRLSGGKSGASTGE